MPRIQPVTPPYDPETAERLDAMMPGGAPPIALFRTFVRNPPMADALRSWGGYELSRALSVSRRLRELVILRTCARCRCEYEWGVHVAHFGPKVGLTAEELTSLTHGSASDPCWTDGAERSVVQLCDELHDTAGVSDPLWASLAATFAEEQLLDLLLLAGWYHAISYAANGAGVEREPGAPRFVDAAGPPAVRGDERP
jgi:alkylhydroperoxidase family enzyme